MHTLAILGSLGALLLQAEASTITAKAILPRATVNGDRWIGVDPVGIGLGSSGQYVAPIGTDTNVLEHHGDDRNPTKVRIPLIT